MIQHAKLGRAKPTGIHNLPSMQRKFNVIIELSSIPECVGMQQVAVEV
jgi:hypothetical protein